MNINKVLTNIVMKNLFWNTGWSMPSLVIVSGSPSILRRNHPIRHQFFEEIIQFFVACFDSHLIEKSILYEHSLKKTIISNIYIVDIPTCCECLRTYLISRTPMYLILCSAAISRIFSYVIIAIITPKLSYLVQILQLLVNFLNFIDGVNFSLKCTEHEKFKLFFQWKKTWIPNWFLFGSYVK